MSPSHRRLRFAVVNEILRDRRGWLDHIRRIEQSGVGTVLIRDHIAAAPFGPQLAPLAMAATVAAHTTRLRVGTMVLSNDYRHPALVAHEAATYLGYAHHTRHSPPRITPTNYRISSSWRPRMFWQFDWNIWQCGS